LLLTSIILIVHHSLLALSNTLFLSKFSNIKKLLPKNTVFHSGKTANISATDNLYSLHN
jgi:hypothetical protein